MTTKHIIGLMSGSSLDGLDIALCRFQYEGQPRIGKIKWDILQSTTIPYSEDWQSRLRKTPFLSAPELLETDAALGQLFGEMVAIFSRDIKIEIDLVVSHGHTVFHFPEKGYTKQIGCGNHLSAKCGLPVLYDVRMADIAQGGQGAPLAPVVDEWLFPEYNIFLNLGGIANISCQTNKGFIGYDVYVANQTLNALAKEVGLEYDKGGRLAAQGTTNSSLRKKLQQLGFLKLPYPKSLDNQWVVNNITKQVLAFEDSIENRLATVTEVIAEEVGKAINALLPLSQTANNTLLITGGGAHNEFLIDRLKHHCSSDLKIIVPTDSIVNNKESLLMALMGVLYLSSIPNSNPSVTGATQNSIGGVWAFPQGKK